MQAAVVLDWLLAGTLALLLPLAPLVAGGIARDASYVRRYPRTVRKALGHLNGLVRSRAFSRYLFYRRTVRTKHEILLGQCTHCGNCCLHGRCIFLDWSTQGESRCRIYNSELWKKLACGCYPETKLELDWYGCPSFTAVLPTEGLGGTPAGSKFCFPGITTRGEPHGARLSQTAMGAVPRLFQAK